MDKWLDQWQSTQWQSTAEFLSGSSSNPVAGLPAKKVHVDSAVQLTASQQKEGQLYTDELANVVNAAPAMCCPNCGGLATHLQEAHLLYTIDVKDSSGKTYKSDLPLCPVPLDMTMPVIGYSVAPCGCKVSQEWASNYARELKRRLDGLHPGEVMDLSVAQRQAKLKKLEALLTRLYKYQSQNLSSDRKRDVDYWIVAVVDQMQRTCPGAHNGKPTPYRLHVDVKDWANRHGHTGPQEPKPAGLVVAVQHSDNGLIPKGTTLSYKPLPYLNDDPNPPPGSAAGSFGYGPDYPLPNKPSYKPVSPAKQQLQVKVVDLSAKSQVKVECNQYGEFIVTLPSGAQQTFQSWNAAKDYAQSLCSQAKTEDEAVVKYLMEEVAAKLHAVLDKNAPPKKVKGLQTLPVEEQLKFHGANEKEKAVYLSALSDAIISKIAKPAFPPALVQQVCEVIQNGQHRGLAYSLIQQSLNAGGDTVDLCKTYNQVVKDLTNHLKGSVLTPLATHFLQAFVACVDFTAPAPTTPVLAPKEEVIAEPSERHLKKRRTLRRLRDV